jgi:hypothetical protein
MGNININRYAVYILRKKRNSGLESYVFYRNSFTDAVGSLKKYMDKYEVYSYHIEEFGENAKNIEFDEWRNIHLRIKRKLRVFNDQRISLKKTKKAFRILNFLRANFTAGRKVFFIQPEVDLTKLR